MRLAFQPGVLADYAHYYPNHLCPSGGVSGLGTASIETITAAAGTIGSAIPVAGPFIAAAAAIAVTIEKLFSGCGATCTQATSIANQVGDLLSQNAQAYVAAPVRTQSMQAAALATFDGAWAQLVQACSNPALSTAGQNCISQRQRGGCQWKASPGGWVQNPDGTCTYTWAGATGSGTACWNYFVGMRDPIALDPCVIPDSVLDSITGQSSAAGTASTSASTLTSLLPLFLIGGGVLLLAEAAH